MITEYGVYVSVPASLAAGETDAEKVGSYLSWLAAQKAAGAPVTILYELPEPVSSYANLDIPLAAQNTITCTDAVLPSFSLREIDGPERRVAWARDLRRANLLINGDFRKPINQRGKTEYASGYGIDMWSCPSQVQIIDGGIILPNSHGFFQYVENLPDGDTVTLTVLHDGILSTVTATISPSMEQARSPDNVAIIGYNKSRGAYQIIIAARGDGWTFQAAKLEAGDRFTGWIETNPQQELAKCQRYGFALDAFQRFRATRVAANQIDFMVPCPVPLRTTPSLPDGMSVVNLAGAGQQGYTMSVLSIRSGVMIIRATKTNHGLPDAILQTSANISFFDANL